MELAPRESSTVGLVAPLAGAATSPTSAADPPDDWLDDAARGRSSPTGAPSSTSSNSTCPPRSAPRRHAAVVARAHLDVARRPGSASRHALLCTLMDPRRGDDVGSRCVRLGHANIAADYLRWFAPHQFENGKVPCCVDCRGADPVPENDSNGQLIFLAAEVFRYTRRSRAARDDCGRMSKPPCATWTA